jgi:hypothetical protein
VDGEWEDCMVNFIVFNPDEGTALQKTEEEHVYMTVPSLVGGGGGKLQRTGERG